MRCFPILNDAIFSQCLEKNIDLDVLEYVWKNPNIILTMHINDVFQTIEKYQKISHIFF